MPRSIALRELAELLGVLAHADRVRIVEELRSGERDVGSLAASLEVASSRVSQHLSVLRAHRIVHKRRESRHVYYRLAHPELATWLLTGLDFLETEAPSLRDSIARARVTFRADDDAR